MNILTLVLINFLMYPAYVVKCDYFGDKKLPVMHTHKDPICDFFYTEKVGLAIGKQAVYIVYGEYKFSGKTIPSGRCISDKNIRKFRIVELLKNNRKLICDRSLKAAAAQEVFNQRAPGITVHIDFETPTYPSLQPRDRIIRYNF